MKYPISRIVRITGNKKRKTKKTNKVVLEIKRYLKMEHQPNIGLTKKIVSWIQSLPLTESIPYHLFLQSQFLLSPSLITSYDLCLVGLDGMIKKVFYLFSKTKDNNYRQVRHVSTYPPTRNQKIVELQSTIYTNLI